MCLLSEGKEVVFRPFDPVKGIGADEGEIGRHDYDPHRVNWTIAPDGSHLAWIEWDAKEARIHTLALQHGRGIPADPEHDILIPGCSHLYAISWAPDGKGWFVVTQFPASWMMFYVDRRGTPRLLLKVTSTYAPDLFPSPNGRYLAFSQQSFESNIWLLEKGAARR